MHRLTPRHSTNKCLAIQESTNIYLGATAGMRLLNLTDSESAMKIIEVAANTLRESLFRFEDGNARK
jgi:hypothetical protein